MIGRALTIRLLLLLASVLLGLGLVAPCMTIQPSFGEFTGWVEMLNPDLTKPTTYSILGGILLILTEDNAALGLLLLGFSAVFPAAKLATLWWGVTLLKAGGAGGAALWLTHHAGKFSMVDVMVISLLVVAIKGMPGGTEIHLRWGLFAFAASVVISMFASMLVKGLEKAVEGKAAVV